MKTVGAEDRVPRLDFELTSACDHACNHCYNVWNAAEGDAQGGYPKGQLHGADYLAMMRKAISQSRCEHVTLTGGEPLLRKDALDIVALATSLVPSVHLVTNGSHVPPETAKRLASLGVRSVQLTLLSADRARHDQLKGAVCFDDTVRAIVDLLELGVRTQVCFVATAANWREFEGVMELCFALGVRGVSYNRMAPAGGAIKHVAALLPEVEQIEHNLDTAERLGPAWGIHVGTAMPILPCLIRIDRYKHVRFGFCSVGSNSPNIVVDALGNVRSCNLSCHVMGNITQVDWRTIHADRYLHTFKATLPEVCQGCAYEASCQGGCKESGYATSGDLRAPEPLLARAIS